MKTTITKMPNGHVKKKFLLSKILNPKSRIFLPVLTLCMVCLVASTSYVTAQPASVTLSFTTPVNNQSDCSFVVALSDTNLVAIEVGLGSTRDQTDLFQHEFTFDETTGLPSGLTYIRDGLTVTLSIGEHPQLDFYYGQVRTKNTNGEWGEMYKFLQN